MPTEAQLRDAALRQRISKLLDDGLLPVMVSDTIIAGYGRGDRSCQGCGLTIESTQVEYEVKDARGEAPMHFHFGCHVLWQIECVNRLRAQAG
jgi:hypothetical protein